GKRHGHHVGHGRRRSETDEQAGYDESRRELHVRTSPSRIVLASPVRHARGSGQGRPAPPRGAGRHHRPPTAHSVMFVSVPTCVARILIALAWGNWLKVR